MLTDFRIKVRRPAGENAAFVVPLAIYREVREKVASESPTNKASQLPSLSRRLRRRSGARGWTQVRWTAVPGRRAGKPSVGVDAKGMVLMIYDMTQALVNPQIQWRSSAPAIATHFEPWVRGIGHGLYVQYFENDAALPVYDKNRDFARGGEGMLLIEPHGASLKPGKFQDGFLRRRRQDADHLHRTRKDQFGHTYRECLKLALVLDLTNDRALTRSATREVEKLLKSKVDEWLRRQDLLHATSTRRGDWRRLRRSVPNDELKESMLAIIAQTTREVGIKVDRTRRSRRPLGGRA